MEGKRKTNKTGRLGRASPRVTGHHSTNRQLLQVEKWSKMEGEPSTYDSLRAWILRLPRVRQAPHRVGGAEFQVDGIEFMHLHGPSWLDIRLSKEDQSSALKAGLALSHKAEVHAQAGWVSFRIENTRDLVNAKKVIQLAYENAKKNTDGTRSRRT